MEGKAWGPRVCLKQWVREGKWKVSLDSRLGSGYEELERNASDSEHLSWHLPLSLSLSHTHTHTQ